MSLPCLTTNRIHLCYISVWHHLPFHHRRAVESNRAAAGQNNVPLVCTFAFIVRLVSFCNWHSNIYTGTEHTPLRTMQKRSIAGGQAGICWRCHHHSAHWVGVLRHIFRISVDAIISIKPPSLRIKCFIHNVKSHCIILHIVHLPSQPPSGNTKSLQIATYIISNAHNSVQTIEYNRCLIHSSKWTNISQISEKSCLIFFHCAAVLQ